MLHVREERKRQGITQFDLARRADIHPSTLSQIETGKVYAYPAWRARLSTALGVPEDALFDNAPNEPSA